jgi:lipid-binding SYLF domain-containing protein
MRRPLLTLCLLTLAIAGLSLATATSAISPMTDEDALLTSATLVFTRAVNTPAAAIPIAALMRASAVAVVPGAVKDGKRYYGKGIVSVRGARPDTWSPPGVIAFEGSIPLDLDSAIINLVVIAETRRGMDYLTRPRVSTAEALAIAAGALGHNSPMRIEADLIAYMQFDAYFAGVTIAEWGLNEMTESNAVLYGRAYSTEDIVRGAGFFRMSSSARVWRDALAGYFREMS